MGSQLGELKQRFNGSVMTYIKGSLIGIISLAICSLFAAFWITELADLDARAINISGSLRMESFQLGMYGLEGREELVARRMASFEQKLADPLFLSLQKQEDLQQLWGMVIEQWQQKLKPILQNLPVKDQELLNQEVIALATKADAFVLAVQSHAEDKIKLLRSIQLAALFITLAFGMVTLHLIDMRVEKPLVELTSAAFAIGKGNFTHQLNLKGDDELALLGATLNHTCEAIASMYGQLEKRVKEQTSELEVNNNALKFLFETARLMLESPQQNVDYKKIVQQLADLIAVNDIELCLMTATGAEPFAQFKPHTQPTTLCAEIDCSKCLGDGPFIAIDKMTEIRFPVVYGNNNYGVVVVRAAQQIPTDSWQHQLIRSVADQIALSMNLSDQHNQERRLALLHERTIIARELHDSLAQALSYLKIQVTRLSKTQQKERFDLQQPIIDELKMGLDSAYRQLRELLTTFRLKMVGEGLEAALTKSIEQLQEQSPMAFHLDFAVKQVPLSPMEEINLLQIAREACQNTVHHSQGENVWVSIEVTDDQQISLSVSDDGVGIGGNSAKLNHYGMAIMQERARHLNGTLTVQSGDEKGTEVKLTFKPVGGSESYH